jgi:CO/xanthine dehydrogenase Mo-binding subunit
MVYDRSESFLGHVHRHPARIWLRHGATRDGKLVIVRARLLIDGGAYASSSTAVIANASTFAAGPYEVPNAAIDGTAVSTNNPPCGAMRGFGAPQVCFAYEAQMDRLADELGLDPIELRLRNVLRPGSVMPTGQVLRSGAPVEELLRRCAAIREPPARSAAADVLELPGGAGNVADTGTVRRGVGLALGYKNLAYSEGFDDSAEARVTLSAGPEGPSAEIVTAAVEVGQGLLTVLTQIARTELGVTDVRFAPHDTARIGSAGSSSASRQTMMAGGAVQAACAAVRRELLARARASFGVPDDAELELADDRLLLDGTPVGDVAALLDPPVSATEVYRHRRVEGFDERGQGDIHVAFAFAAERAVVEVDEELGLVRVLQIAAVQEVGHALNPAGVTGQIEGGTAQGLGFALMEELVLDDGAIRNGSFTDYLIPTILDMPEVVAEVIEEPEPGVPFGAKGVGEPSTIVAPAAVAAAVRAATGRRLNRIPMRPDDIVGLRDPLPWREPPDVPDVVFQTPLPAIWLAEQPGAEPAQPHHLGE